MDQLCSLAFLGAKEYAKDIAKLLGDKKSYVRSTAARALGKLGAKEYVDDIKKLLEDSGICRIYNKTTDNWKETTVDKIAKKVLQDWGYKVTQNKDGTWKVE